MDRRIVLGPPKQLPVLELAEDRVKAVTALEIGRKR